MKPWLQPVGRAGALILYAPSGGWQLQAVVLTQVSWELSKGTWSSTCRPVHVYM